MSSASTSSALGFNGLAAVPHPAVAAQPSQRGKRRFQQDPGDAFALSTKIDDNFISRCQAAYKSSPMKETLRNVITTIGTSIAATSEERSKRIPHEFAMTHRIEHYAALDQAGSGRCWIYASLNMIRPFVMGKFESKKNIEFSTTYIFFWHKFEGARTYLLEILNHLDAGDDDRILQAIQKEPISDGGCFDYFVSLVDKYGLVPHAAMPETEQTYVSATMNEILIDRLNAAAFILRRDAKKMTNREQVMYVDATMMEIYNDLVTFLGEPPKKFSWAFFTDNEDGPRWNRVEDITPHEFWRQCLPQIDRRSIRKITEANQDDPRYKIPFDFNNLFVVSNLPHLAFNRLYECEGARSIYEGRKPRFLNVCERDFEKLTLDMWKYTPVWMACDMGRNFSYMCGAIDSELVNRDRILDPMPQLTKAERFKAGIQTTNHAMTIIGLNLDPDTHEIRFLEIENSWGYIDSVEPGLDGFISMSREAFMELCTEIVVMKHLLPERLQRLLEGEPQVISRWTACGDMFLLPDQPPGGVYQEYRRFVEMKRLSITRK